MESTVKPPSKVKFSDENHAPFTRGSSSSGPVAHSTPSKIAKPESHKRNIGTDMPDGATTRFSFTRDLHSPTKQCVTDMERDTIIKQRTELQLLINELKDRDRELNEMVTAHHQHMKAWEEDRVRCTNTESRNAKLDRDLQKRNSQIRELLKKLKSIEVEALNASTALDNTKMQLSAVVEDNSSARCEMKELQEQNNHLQRSLQDVSQTLGEAESKVNQLNTALNKKEKEGVNTSKEVTELSSRLKSLEFSYKQLEKITYDVKQSAAEWKAKCNDLRQDGECMRSELNIANATAEEKDITLQNILRDMKEKKDELAHALEREKRKDQLLDLQKSKQERTDTELTTLRQMYDIQQHKLDALRKELAEVKDTARQQTASFCVTDDSEGLTMNESSFSTGSAFCSPVKKAGRISLSPQKSHSSLVDRSDESVNSATERLQMLLRESKSLVDNINGNQQSRSSSRFSDTRMSPSGVSFNLSTNGGN